MAFPEHLNLFTDIKPTAWSVYRFGSITPPINIEQAPIRPTKRTSASKQRTTFTKSTDDIFHNSKRDKREMKHSLLLSKARKSAGVTKSLKRRRPSKKLVTTMESLEDALPELEDAQIVMAKTTAQGAVDARNKSLGSKPGVRKKRERIEREERERFGKNLAVLSMARPKDDGEAGAATGGTSNRWAALRAHLNSSMAEQGAAGG
ncbi:Actin cytoskeleton-regulatory complex protein [Venturia nashicola]|uniref:Ribosome biogenesis protein SLX9 n=1 Tax=Venturia nashicola TaxID=86259 RepID=A0A4Z1PV81_9PEZI|nr:Actin cytoskeleton-regulatory complex protein [Venturia nashicola]